jgi:hypothetical protein
MDSMENGYFISPQNMAYDLRATSSDGCMG